MFDFFLIRFRFRLLSTMALRRRRVFCVAFTRWLFFLLKESNASIDSVLSM